MTDRYTFQHGPLEVKAPILDPDGGWSHLEVHLSSEEIYRTTVMSLTDPEVEAEAADLFKAFKAVYEAGEASDGLL